MKSGNRSLVAIVLSIVILIVWFKFINPPKPVDNTKAQATSAEVSNEKKLAKKMSNSEILTEEKVVDVNNSIPEQKITISNLDLEATLTNIGGEVVDWKTTNYKQTTAKDSPPINLATLGALSTKFENANFIIPKDPRYKIIKAEPGEVVFKWTSKEVEITKKIKLPENGYAANVEVIVKNRTNKPIMWNPNISWVENEVVKKETGILSFLKRSGAGGKNILFFNEGSIDRWKTIKGAKNESGDIVWAGIEDRYFISAIVPRAGGKRTVNASENTINSTRELDLTISGEQVIVSPKDEAFQQYVLYSGPKDREQLESVGVGLEKSIDYGWFSIIAVPIFYLLQIFYRISGNYGIAIILLTIFIRLLLHPINLKSLKSMKAMQKIQPQLKALQAKYKDDKQTLNMETMKLFKANKVNPMGGCLPMLLQFPVFIALYRVLWNSIQLYHAPFFWFYKDLSAPDPYFISPILMGVAMFLQQKLTPTAADPAQKKMMMIMPIMFTAFMLFLPAGLVIYIFISTAMAVAQQYMYNKGISWWRLLGFRRKRAST